MNILTARLNVSSEAIQQFCERWRIRELALFGSVLRDDFRADSDLDVLVTFASDVTYSLFQLATIADELEELLHRPIDLVDRQALEQSYNHIRKREILSHSEVIYAAP
jgi:predicted nucleotidyltransferase